ncbi:MAG: UDP-N-acetylmuramoyl-tripeptide--D-alanyl-D-alanine ligase [Candidatus Aureabacteria bacterium]|nr:UDP-N-acetylmuramoyl-tripeptide--D-alanyl-D-alanine ligase [Candidatus Auribacterota bacterium]
MEPIVLGDCVEWAQGRLISGEPGRPVAGISTDTRTLSGGDFFIALRGATYDGHDYLGRAVDLGAGGVVVSADIPPGDARRFAGRGVAVVKVGNTLTALQDIAAAYRRRFGIPVVAITGSNGKTTTKEMVRVVASQRMPLLASEGTFNNHVGVPLTLLRIERRHRLAVLELGMNHPGEIGRLASLADPNIGVITNVGPAHLEFLGTLQGVADAKGELVWVMEAGSASRSRTAVLNSDDPLLRGMAGRCACPVVTFGLGEGAGVRGESVRNTGDGTSFTIRSGGDSCGVILPALGVHNVHNALAAAAVCTLLGMGMEEIAAGLAEVRMPPMRMERLTMDGVTVINDAYNANPGSMRAAIDTFTALQGCTRKILVIGDMLELGRAADEAHREVGRRVAEGGIDVLIAVGEGCALAAVAARERGMSPERVLAFRDAGDAAAALRERMRPGDCVMLKGSRRMKLEEMLRPE